MPHASTFFSGKEATLSSSYATFPSLLPLTSSLASSSSTGTYQRDLQEGYACENGITAQDQRGTASVKISSTTSPHVGGGTHSSPASAGRDPSLLSSSFSSASIASSVTAPSTLPTPRCIPSEEEARIGFQPATAPSEASLQNMNRPPSLGPNYGNGVSGEREQGMRNSKEVVFNPVKRVYSNSGSRCGSSSPNTNSMRDSKRDGDPRASPSFNSLPKSNDIFFSTLAKLSQSYEEVLRQSASAGNSVHLNYHSSTGVSGSTSSHGSIPLSSPPTISPSFSPPSLGSRMAAPSLSSPPSTSVTPFAGGVHPAEYSDRRRLLYHITHLATQCQRAQLQVEEQQAALVLLHAHFQSLQAKVENEEKREKKNSSSRFPSACSEIKDPRGGENQEEEEDEEGEDENEKEDVVRPMQVEVHPSGLTAAVLVSKNEAALQEHIRSRLPLFDPLLAQTQINRLDDALACVSLLREAELARAQQAEEVELPPLRVECEALRKEVQSLRSQNTHLEQQCAAQQEQLLSTSSEVERLRAEEMRLNHQLTVLQRFQHTVAGVGPTISGGSTFGEHLPLRDNAMSPVGFPSSHPYAAAIRELCLEESHARQALWLSMFWEPMAMAFDAGLTWLLEMERKESECQFAALEEAIKVETENRRATYPAVVHHALRLQEEGEDSRNYTSLDALGARGRENTAEGRASGEMVGEDVKARTSSSPRLAQCPHCAQGNFAKNDTGDESCATHPHKKNGSGGGGSASFRCSEVSVYESNAAIARTDADLLLLQNQQAELREARLQLEKAQQQKHILELEVSRLQALYKNEKEQAIQLSETHIVQLHRAYQEIVRDRQLIKASLQKEVEQQVKAAFSEGRLYEQKLHSKVSAA